MNHISKKRMNAALLLALMTLSTAAPAFSWVTAANADQAKKLGLTDSAVPMHKDVKQIGVAVASTAALLLVAQMAQAGVNGYVGDAETRALPRSVKDKLLAGAKAAVSKDQLSNAGFVSLLKVFKKDITRDINSTVGRRLLEWVLANKTFAGLVGLEVIGGVVVLVKEAGKNSEWNVKVADRGTKLGDAKAWYTAHDSLDDKTSAELAAVIQAAQALSGLTAAEIEKLSPDALEAKLAELAKLAKDKDTVIGYINAEKANRAAPAELARLRALAPTIGAPATADLTTLKEALAQAIKNSKIQLQVLHSEVTVKALNPKQVAKLLTVLAEMSVTEKAGINPGLQGWLTTRAAAQQKLATLMQRANRMKWLSVFRYAGNKASALHKTATHMKWANAVKSAAQRATALESTAQHRKWLAL